ncbi:MAG: filamentous hemagglutinin N-terminal domain-containing protein [Stigonema ocellatum SAG 48.90 = DSM 106950]|nr:filamentous hemagglutinin N-terminal domain-containing protein [Stigonema ocellatum SAG 48.90 = DSM 106950]
MKQGWRSLFVITLPLATLGSLGSVTPTRAQITPDNTLGAESSVVNRNVDVGKGIPSDRIDGGARRGANLFHSFQEFNIDAGRGVYFSNPAGIQNILSRVTGGNPSNILGTLGVLGNANLFFINPNGIIFGPNARLDVGGSFVASTASSVVFPNGLEFSATDPQAPPLLTVNIPIGLRFRDNPGSITNQSISVDANNNFVGLQVPSGNTLALVGGNVSLDGGIVTAAGGRVELGGLAQAGMVGLNPDGSLSFPEGVVRGDVSLTNAASVDVTANGGGSIAVNARNFELSGRSFLLAGITPDSRVLGVQAGDIVINATQLTIQDGSQVIDSTSGAGKGGNLAVTADSIQLTGTSSDGTTSSGLFAIANPGSTGNAGDLTIKTGQLTVQGGAVVSATIFGKGNSGSLAVTADSIQLTGTSSDGTTSSGLFAQANFGSTGNAGDLTIKTGQLTVQDGAKVIAGTIGAGNGGNLTVNATGQLTVQGGAVVSATTFGKGNSGSLAVSADSIQLTGTSSDGTTSSGLFAIANPGSTGNAGDLTINTGQLTVQGGAQIGATTSGTGAGGNISITTTGLLSEVGSNTAITVSTTGTGKSGNINIKAGDLSLSSNAALTGDVNGTGGGGKIDLNVTGAITLDGSTPATAPTGESTRITLGVDPNGRGTGGDLTIHAGSLVLKNGAIIKDSTQGMGDAGNIDVHANNIDISGSVAQSGLPSGLFTSTNNDYKAGNITIKTDSFKISDGAALSARSTGNGQAGTITVTTKSFDASNGGQLVTTTNSSKQPQASNIIITADRMTISGKDQSYNARIAKFPNPTDPSVANDIKQSDGTSGLFASTSGQAQGGDINVTTGSLSLTNNAQLDATTTGQGIGGTVMINANALEINRGGQILTTASNSGKAGDITVNASDRISLENTSSGILANTTSSSTGDGGKITIQPKPNQLKFPDITIADGAQVAANSQGSGKGGDISIQANTLTLNQGTLTASTNKNDGGNIILNLQNYLLLRNKSQIFANAGSGTGGNIKIDTPFIISFPSKNSINSITANATTGEGGKIEINAGLFGIAPLTQQEIDGLRSQPPTLPTQSYIAAYSEKSQNLNGNVTVNSPDVDPSRTIVELPQVVVDPVNKIAQNPCQQGAGSSFIVTGRGGLPRNPNEALSSNNVLVDLVKPVSTSTYSPSATIKPLPSKPTVKRIVPAQGWVFNDKGEVVLTAYDPLGTGHQRTSKLPAACPAF